MASQQRPGASTSCTTRKSADIWAPIHGGLLATLTAWCEQHGIPYQGVPVGTIKRHITGKGNADKQAVITAVRERGFNPADNNEADAIAILLWAIDTRGGVRWRGSGFPIGAPPKPSN
jgi:hypothetical protein